MIRETDNEDTDKARKRVGKRRKKKKTDIVKIEKKVERNLRNRKAKENE